MSTTFNTRIQLKYDTYENWNTNNPTLLKGEMAVVEVPVETGVAQNEPTYLLKIGDGTSDFKTLKWVSGTAADVYAWAKAATIKQVRFKVLRTLLERKLKILIHSTRLSKMAIWDSNFNLSQKMAVLGPM